LLLLPSSLVILPKSKDTNKPNMSVLTDEYLKGLIRPGIQGSETNADLITEWNNADPPPHWSKLDETGDGDGGNIRENVLGKKDKWKFTSLSLDANEFITKLVYKAYIKKKTATTSTYVDIDTSVSTAGYWSATDNTYHWKEYIKSGLWLDQSDLDGFWLQAKIADIPSWNEGYNPGWVDINTVYVEVYAKKELVDLTIVSPLETIFHATRGHYLGTYTFENDEKDMNPAGWIVDETGGEVSIYHDSVYGFYYSFLGHKKVVQMLRTSSSGNVRMTNTFSNRISGTVEFYVLPTLEANYDIIMGHGNPDSGYLQLRFDQNGFLKYYDGSWHQLIFEYAKYLRSYSDFHWFHIKIVFGCDYNPYWPMGSWNLYVDGVRLDPEGGFEFVGYTPYMNQIEFTLPTDHVGKILFVDAIGYSWDSQYSIGDNLKEGLYLKFTGAEYLTWRGYSLDGNPVVTIPGNTLIPMPTYGEHAIQVFGEDSSGNPYETEERNFFNYYLYNDEDEVINWGVDHINAERVWGETEDALDVITNIHGGGINVLIIDDGIDYNHPDLDDNYIEGYDEYYDDSDPFSHVVGHGTMCAGVIGAEDNGIGFVGVAPNVNLYVYKVADDYGILRSKPNPSGPDISPEKLVAMAIDRAIATLNDADPNNNIDIISISLGTGLDESSLEYSCWIAYSNDIIVVAAAGNDGTGTLRYPARYQEYVIPVGASDFNDQKTSFSNWGYQSQEEGIVAPGINIGSTCLTNDYAWGETDYNFWNGTSFAAPMVAGVCALILSANPSLRTIYGSEGFSQLTDMVKYILYTTANPVGQWDTYIGNGVVDAEAAVTEALTY
ncbi:MAG: S8 family serine peptidase, partial [Promethearchaeota archaeon]